VARQPQRDSWSSIEPKGGYYDHDKTFASKSLAHDEMLFLEPMHESRALHKERHNHSLKFLPTLLHEHKFGPTKANHHLDHSQKRHSKKKSKQKLRQKLR
jgi:hypothetical protein